MSYLIGIGYDQGLQKSVKFALCGVLCLKVQTFVGDCQECATGCIVGCWGMTDLTIINHNGTHAIDSREVAAMVGKEHNMLLRDIRTYCGYLGQSKIAQSDFFIESTYLNSQNKAQPCYLITKKGCDMRITMAIANVCYRLPAIANT